MFPDFWSFFEPPVCGYNPIENVVGTFVQAAGRVHMGRKVLVSLEFHVLLGFGVHAGLLDTFCHVLRGRVGLCLQHVFRGMCPAVPRACLNTASLCFRTFAP